MDQTSFSLCVGLLVGSHAGAFSLRLLTGWSWWITYPTGGLVGLILFAAATFVSIEFLGRLFGGSRRELRELLIEAVRATPELPESLRTHVAEARAVKKHQFDQSYIEFLDEQIRLSPRGPEWTEHLRRRRAALSPFCSVTLVRGRVLVADKDFMVEVHPTTRAVVHWEEYEMDIDA